MSTGTELNPELINPTLPFSEAMNGLLELTQLLASLHTPEGIEAGLSPVIVLTSRGVEVRMGDAAPFARSAPPAAGEPRQQWFRKIEEGLESVRQATAALSATLAENARNVDQTLASHSAAIETVRAALTQNEQLMESMVELMAPSEFNLTNPDEFANIS
jgi:hypothetical protein